MACPFSRERFKAEHDEGSDTQGNSRARIGRLGQDDKSRQSSFEVTSLLMREEIEDPEDTQTLNLKHLRAAVLVLTNPSVTESRFFISNDLYEGLKEYNFLQHGGSVS